jgi:hypothetical protein
LLLPDYLDSLIPKLDKNYPVLLYPEKWGFSSMAACEWFLQNVFTQENLVSSKEAKKWIVGIAWIAEPKLS